LFELTPKFLNAVLCFDLGFELNVWFIKAGATWPILDIGFPSINIKKTIFPLINSLQSSDSSICIRLKTLSVRIILSQSVLSDHTHEDIFFEAEFKVTAKLLK